MDGFYFLAVKIATYLSFIISCFSCISSKAISPDVEAGKILYPSFLSKKVLISLIFLSLIWCAWPSLCLMAYKASLPSKLCQLIKGSLMAVSLIRLGSMSVQTSSPALKEVMIGFLKAADPAINLGILEVLPRLYKRTNPL